MNENNDFELSNLLDEAKVAPMEIPDAQEAGAQTQGVKEKFIDPEDDRKNWPVIRIGHVKGLPNFQFLAAAGTKKNGSPFGHELRVMRGVDVAIPPSILNMLQVTVRTEYEQSYDKDTGLGIRTPIDSPPIPYQLVKGGKYF